MNALFVLQFMATESESNDVKTEAVFEKSSLQLQFFFTFLKEKMLR